MRISTAQLYDGGASGIGRNQSALYRLQTQMSTGRKILTPSDDPVHSAQAMVTLQSQSVNREFMSAQDNARSSLEMTEGQLTSLTELLQNVRERTVQLGNPTLTDKERGFIAEELEAQFVDLLNIANAQNGEGQFLFSGFQGATRPFGLSANVPPFSVANSAIIYSGDEGQRLLQVEASRQIPITVSGKEVFMDVMNGNGTFAVKAGTNLATGTANTGTGIADGGTVIDLNKWEAALVQPQNFQIRFAQDTTDPNNPVLKYNIVDVASGNSAFTNAAPSAVNGGAEWKTFTSNQAIQFTGLNAAFTADPAGDLGVQLIIDGTPGDGDTFSVRSSQAQNLFDTFQNLIHYSDQPVKLASGGNSDFYSRLNETVQDLDQALEKVLRIRANVGARLNEVDLLKTASADFEIQYSERISNLQDLDYTEAITELNSRQLQLEAAQKSFVRITSLSLFDML